MSACFKSHFFFIKLPHFTDSDRFITKLRLCSLSNNYFSFEIFLNNRSSIL